MRKGRRARANNKTRIDVTFDAKNGSEPRDADNTLLSAKALSKARKKAIFSDVIAERRKKFNLDVSNVTPKKPL